MSYDLVIDAVDRTLCFYDSEDIDVVVNEETGMVDIIYHSRNNSFPIESGIVSAKRVNKSKLIKELDLRHVGHCP